MKVREMIGASASEAVADVELLATCIEACYECAQACSACADACLGEEKIRKLTTCISLNEVCSDVCETTGASLSRTVHVRAREVPLRILLQACAEVCGRCGEECVRHAGHMEHCRICAEACRRCEVACRQLLEAIAA